MSAGRRTDGALNAGATLALVQCLATGQVVRYEDVVASISISESVPKIYVKNTISLLVDIDILQVENGQVLRSPICSDDPAKWHNQISSKLLEHFLTLQTSQADLNALRLDALEKTVVADSFLLRGSEKKLPYMLQEFKIFTRATLGSRHWLLDPMYFDAVLSELKRENLKKTSSRKTSIEDLEKILAAQVAAGKAAEEWVVEFECKRLTGHIFCDTIRRISDEDIEAGFDILSFSGLSALRHDRYIEVKSFVGPPSFYWSHNEIRKAKELGEKYHLYLVDREMLDTIGYEPITISGPHSYFLDNDPPGWTKTCDKYLLEKRIK